MSYTEQELEEAAKALCVSKGISPNTLYQIHNFTGEEPFDFEDTKGLRYIYSWRQQVEYAKAVLDSQNHENQINQVIRDNHLLANQRDFLIEQVDKLLAEKEELIEKCAKIAGSFRRKRIGRDMDKAYFDPCGRWEGGEIYEKGETKDLIAGRIRALKNG